MSDDHGGGPTPPERDIPIIATDMPVMYEDEGQDEMGESTPHTEADQILSLGIRIHLRPRPQYHVFSNLNCYYHRLKRWAYVSPDVMVVEPSRPLSEVLGSYRIGSDGPAPLLTIEILSRRSFQQQDLTEKPIIYSDLGVAEYILVDGTGQFLEQRLLLRRLQADGSWYDEQDADGGVTSALGFRIVLEEDTLPRVIETATGRRYLRPDEGEEAAEEARAAAETAETARREAELARLAADAARQAAEQRVRELEAELERLRRGQPPAPRA